MKKKNDETRPIQIGNDILFSITCLLRSSLDNMHVCFIEIHTSCRFVKKGNSGNTNETVVT